MAIAVALSRLFGLIPSIIVFSIIALPIAVIAYYATISAYNIWLHPLAKYPGPLLARAGPLWMIRSYFHGTMPAELLKLHERYGPVVRTSPNELSYINPIQWREIYGFKPHGQSEFVKDPIYHAALKPNISILNSDARHHGYLRRLLAHGFSEKSLRDQEPVLKAFVDTLFRRLREECGDGEKPVDIRNWYNFLSFDVISYLTFGESFNCLTTGTFHIWVAIFFSAARNFSYYQMSARLPSLIRGPFQRYFIPEKVKEDLATIYSLNEVRFRQINLGMGLLVRLLSNEKEKTKHRLENNPSVPDFMDNLVDAYQSGKLSAESLKENTQILIGAGSETTATCLAGLTWFLFKNPRVLEKLKTEIRSRFTHPDEITIAAVNECRYLLGCIEECLRMYPPSPQPHHRIIPAGGALVNGEMLPGGTSVSIPIYAIANSPLNWTEPESFIPERWTGEDPRFANDRREVSKPFSYGPRNCIGLNLAYAEMKLIMAGLIWHFDIENVTEGDWMDQKVYLVWEKGPLWVKLRPIVRT
ncbi:hypothetical protein RRF57_001492 [Xylaria bambusicola]|uniref:Cytochrome P450 monooxygenase n=1 Tax=Xylaria bambusicola TaxID=326684 RepID=A0AAN7UQV3_9PEZI